MKRLLESARHAVRQLTPPVLAQVVRRLRQPPESSELVESRRRVDADDYVNWLCMVVGGWLSPGAGNLAAFDHAIRRMPAGGAVVEIGSFLGLSTNILAYLLIKYGRPNGLFTADPWTFERTEEPLSGYFDGSTDAYRDYAKHVFTLNARLFSPSRLPFTVQAPSDRFFELWDAGARAEDVFGRTTPLGGAISFAYIDGAHTYEAARADFWHVDRHLLPGGYVLLDDTSDDCPFASRQVIPEIVHHPSYHLVFKTPHYFFRKS
jgi:hypothetical protein